VKSVLGQRIDSRLNCGTKLGFNFLVFGKIRIPTCSGRLKNCVKDNFERVFFCLFV